jgi:hypothetical protein
MKKIFILFLMSLLMLTSVSLKAQCRYCNSYEDYVAGRWQPLDTIYFDQHSKSHQVWWGGSDFTLKTGDKALDKKLKKEVFAVMQADTIYVNCRNLRYEKARFGNGYSRAIRMGQNDLLFVNRKIGRKEQMNAGAMAGVFGVLGGAIGGGISMLIANNSETDAEKEAINKLADAYAKNGASAITAAEIAKAYNMDVADVTQE